MGLSKTQAFPSKYLSQGDLPLPKRAVIASVMMDTLTDMHGRSEEKAIVLFAGDVKPLVLNLTNWDTIQDAYGEDTDQWAGKVVELYTDPNVMLGAIRKGGIRVRIPSGVPATAPAGGNGAVPFATIIAEAAEVGMSRDDMVAALKAKGLGSYNSVRDAATARAIIARSAPEEGFDDVTIDPNGGEDSIPF